MKKWKNTASAQLWTCSNNWVSATNELHTILVCRGQRKQVLYKFRVTFIFRLAKQKAPWRAELRTWACFNCSIMKNAILCIFCSVNVTEGRLFQLTWPKLDYSYSDQDWLGGNFLNYVPEPQTPNAQLCTVQRNKAKTKTCWIRMTAASFTRRSF